MADKTRSQLLHDFKQLQNRLMDLENRIYSCESSNEDLKIIIEKTRRDVTSNSQKLEKLLETYSDEESLSAITSWQTPSSPEQPVSDGQADAQEAHLARMTMIGEMAASLAHEMSKPLTNILTYSQACLRLLKSDDWEKDDLVNALERVVFQAQFGAQFISRFRRFLSLGDPEPAPVKLNELIQEALHLCEPEFRHNQVTLELQLAESLPDILGDRLKIEQVILNLVRNSLEAMQSTPPEERHLTISTRQTDNEVECAVSDSGCGLTVEMIQKLFEPTRSNKTTGMGMGLTLCRKIIQKHQGFIWAKPNPDKGTTFFFVLPIVLAKGNHKSATSVSVCFSGR